jgi:hypothetical protein
MTSSIPAGDGHFIPAQFRVFPFYYLWNPGVEGKEVQPGPPRDRISPGGHRCRQSLTPTCERSPEFQEIIRPGTGKYMKRKSGSGFQITHAIMIAIKNRSGKIGDRFLSRNRSAILRSKSIRDFHFETGLRLKTGLSSNNTDGA